MSVKTPETTIQIKPDKDIKSFIYKILLENNISKDVDEVEKDLYECLKEKARKKDSCMGFTDKGLADLIIKIAGSGRTKTNKNDEMKKSIFPTEQAKQKKAEEEGKDYQIPLL